MIVQIDNTNTKAIVSGHFFKYDCPDRVNYTANNDINMGKNDAIIKSGHRAKSDDKLGFNSVSGHSSGHKVILIKDKGQDKGQTVPYNANRKDEFDDKGHDFYRGCLDKPKSNGINGQFEQNKVGSSDCVRYNANDCIEINQNIGHFIGHVR